MYTTRLRCAPGGTCLRASRRRATVATIACLDRSTSGCGCCWRCGREGLPWTHRRVYRRVGAAAAVLALCMGWIVLRYVYDMTRGASATTYTQRRKRSTARTQAGWSRAYVRAYRGAVAPQSDVRCPCVCVGAERRFLVLVSLLLFVFLLLFLLITTAVRSKYSCW